MPRNHKDWLKAYLQYTSMSESPEIFHFWTGVSTIAGCLRRRVWIDQRYFEWTPNFYIIFVAPPGISTKSTTINVGMSLLREVDGVKFGPDSGTWQAIGKSLMEAKELVPLNNSYGVADLEGEMQEMSCITCAVGELGTFLDFTDRKLIDTLTALWDGQRGSFEHRTSTQGVIMIDNPWINIISGTTPAWLKRNVPEEAIGGGFASRVIFVFGDRKRHLVAYPGLASDHNKFNQLRKELVADLQEISLMIGEMVLTPEAVTWGQSWYEEHWDKRPIHMASERFEGYIARKQTHIHKLSMVLSAAQGSSRVIELSHLKAAEKITSGMEADMINVFESIGVTPTTRLLSEVIKFLHAYEENNVQVTQTMLYRHCFQFMSESEFTETINIATKAGYLEVRQVGAGQIIYKLKVKPADIGKMQNSA